MTSITKFDVNVYSEELHQFSEAEYDEVMQASAVEDGWQGYADWSTEIETRPLSLGRIGGVE